MDLFDSLISTAGDGLRSIAIGLFNSLIESVVSSTHLNLSSPGFLTQYMKMAAIGLALLVPFFAISVITSIVKGNATEVIRSLIVSIGIGVAGVPATLFVARLLQLLDTNLTKYVLAYGKGRASSFLDTLNGVDSKNPDMTIRLLTMVVLFFVFIGLFSLLLELIIRDLLVMMTLIFLPIALAAGVWKSARGVMMKMFETLIIAIFARTIAIASLFLGLAMVEGGVKEVDASRGPGSEAYLGPAPGVDQIQADSGLGLLIAGAIVIGLAASQLPVLLTMFVGHGVHENVSAKAEWENSPFSPTQGKPDARKMALDGIKEKGSQLKSGAGKAANVAKQLPKLLK